MGLTLSFSMKFFHAIGALLLALIVFLGGFSFGQNSVEAHATPQSASGRQEQERVVIQLLISYGDGRVDAVHNVAIEEGEALFTVLDRVFSQEGIGFEYRDYRDMGVFITAIGNVPGEGASQAKWWQYYVNGVYAQVGVSGYFPKNGDVITLFYMSAQQ